MYRFPLNPVSRTLLFILLVSCPTVIAREDIILSLEAVIGPPPDKSEYLKSKPRETFYSVVSSAKNPELERLIQQRMSGIPLTEEEEELLKEYQQGGSVSGGNSVMRRIYPPVLNWVETSIKTSSGKRYPFINCAPAASGPFVTALVLDPEISQQFAAGEEDYNAVIRRMPVEAELPWEEPYRGRYITHSPIGNQLMAHAISVIIPIRESLEHAKNISLEDWSSVMDHFMKRKDLDAESLFLVSTKEFAGLAMRLAATYAFKGLLLEEPEAGLFGVQLPADTEDTMKMMALADTYESHLKNLTCPTLIFRHRGNPVIPLNDALIMKTMMKLERPLFLSMTDVPLRSIGSRESEEAESEPDPRFVYDADSTKKITQRMLYFIQQHGKSPLSLLPEESNTPRSSNRAGSLINQFEHMTRRLDSLISETGSGSDGGEGDDTSDGGGDDGSGEF